MPCEALSTEDLGDSQVLMPCRDGPSRRYTLMVTNAAQGLPERSIDVPYGILLLATVSADVAPGGRAGVEEILRICVSRGGQNICTVQKLLQNEKSKSLMSIHRRGLQG